MGKADCVLGLEFFVNFRVFCGYTICRLLNRSGPASAKKWGELSPARRELGETSKGTYDEPVPDGFLSATSTDWMTAIRRR